MGTDCKSLDFGLELVQSPTAPIFMRTAFHDQPAVRITYTVPPADRENLLRLKMGERLAGPGILPPSAGHPYYMYCVAGR